MDLRRVRKEVSSYNPERRAWRGRSYKKGGERVRELREEDALKIINAGKQAGTLKSECQDPSCECVVELEPSDCRKVSDDRDGAAIIWTCPSCKRDNWVAVSTVPGAFARAVR